jgi:hypothetical protein
MKENNVSRRDFVKTLGVVGVGSMVGVGQALAQSNAPSATAAPVPVKPVKIPTRPFGRTKVPVAILGPGGDFDIEANQIILKQALDWGVTYWDTSGGSNAGRSERGIGMFLDKNPQARREVFLSTKYDGGGMTQGLNQSLERLKTDYVDLYFLHGINNTGMLNDDLKAWVEKAKADKKIRFFGFATHANMENCLQESARLGWIDGIMFKYEFRLMHTHAGRHRPDRDEDPRQGPAWDGDRGGLEAGRSFHPARIHPAAGQAQGRLGEPANHHHLLANAEHNHSLGEHRRGAGQNQPDGGGPRGVARICGGDAIAALRRLHAILRSHARPSGAGGRRDARAHVSPQLRQPGTGTDRIPPVAGDHTARLGRLRLHGGGTGVSAWFAHRAIDAGSRRIIRVILDSC